MLRVYRRAVVVRASKEPALLKLSLRSTMTTCTKRLKVNAPKPSGIPVMPFHMISYSCGRRESALFTEAAIRFSCELGRTLPTPSGVLVQVGVAYAITAKGS